MSGRVGGADVLEALGVRIDLPPERVADCIDQVGIGFLFAQTFHPAMKHAAGPRRELGVRTIFNLLGPLSNPAGARRQVIGVFSAQWTEPLAEVLLKLGSAHCLVVHGEDGLDEISLTAATRISELRAGQVRTYRLTPEELGLRRCSLADIQGGTPAEAAAMVRAVVQGDADSARSGIALLNAAAAIYVGGRGGSMVECLATARASVSSGAAARKLADLVEATSR
jgi:anthranilate phosphoribosyltransferase